MAGFGRAGRLAALGAFLAVLGACSSFGGLPPPAAGGTMLDSADLAAALFAVDMPASVEPGEGGPRVTYGALDVTLVRADAEPVMAVLPPPAVGRFYAVYAFDEGDRQAVRNAIGRSGTAIIVTPGLCLTPAADKARDTIAVFAVLPGQQPVPLVPTETLAALEARTGALLSPCAGHSG